MSNHRSRFLFDNVFEPGKPMPEQPAKPKPKFTDDDLAAARREGQEAGHRMGMEQAKRQLEARMAATLETAAQRLAALDQAMQASLETIRADATQVALAIAGRLAPALIARQPLSELAEMVAACLRQMPTEPRVVVRVADELVESLQAQIAEIAAGSGFAGQLVLIGESDLPAGDCRVEWADGGAERRLAALQAEIDAAVDRYCRGQHALAAQRAAATTGPTETSAPDAPPAAPRADADGHPADDDDTDSTLPAVSGAGGAH